MSLDGQNDNEMFGGGHDQYTEGDNHLGYDDHEDDDEDDNSDDLEDENHGHDEGEGDDWGDEEKDEL